MIIGNAKTMDIIKVIKPLENKFGREINFTIYSPSEFNQKKEKRSFLKEVMKNKKIMLLGEIEHNNAIS